jgi:hypothetical protein
VDGAGQQTRIRDGVVLLEDGQAPRPVRVGLSSLNLDVKGLDSRMGKAPIDIKLKPKLLPVNTRGLLRPARPTASWTSPASCTWRRRWPQKAASRPSACRCTCSRAIWTAW